MEWNVTENTDNFQNSQEVVRGKHTKYAYSFCYEARNLVLSQGPKINLIANAQVYSASSQFDKFYFKLSAQ